MVPWAARGVDPTDVVVGAHGLLGSATIRRLKTLGREAVAWSVPWKDPDAATAALLAQAGSLGSHWRLYWCAGAGIVGTSQEALDSELAVMERFLSRWVPTVGEGCGVFFASSAGGVYAGATGSPFTEATEAVAVSPYGWAKLRAEAAFEAFATRTGAPLLVGRLSNLYGPGQDLLKPQGLISQLCVAHLTRQPLSIYVSLDTRRDYLYVEDAAAMTVAALDEVAEQGGSHAKVLASERSTTIGAILGDLTRITRRRAPVVLGSSPQARYQVIDLRFRSVAWPPVSVHARTPLVAGMAATLSSVGDGMRTAGRPR